MAEKIKALVDTGLLLDYITDSGSAGHFDKIVQLADKNVVSLGVSVISLAELGILIGDDNTRNKILSYLNAGAIDKVPVCQDTALKAADLQRKYGMNMSEALQLTTAIRNDYDVVLSSNAWLKRITEVKVIDPQGFLTLLEKKETQ